MACPNFGTHGLVPLDVSRFDHHSCIDPVTFIGMGTRAVVLMDDPVPVTALVPVPVTALAMSCPPVVPRRKPRFVVATPDDVEVYPVDVVFRNYGYAIDQIRDKPPRAVVRVDGGNNITDWTSYAIARYRAIELANGD
eukprot:16451920-Heterocapsa_arctica.AAC.1